MRGRFPRAQRSIPPVVYTERSLIRAFYRSSAGDSQANPVWSLILPLLPSTPFPARLAALALFAAMPLAMRAVPAPGQEPLTPQVQPAPATAAAGTIQGVVMNRDQAVYEGARVELASGGQGARRSVTTDPNGRFVFSGVPAGPFTVTASAPGFSSANAAGILQAGQSFEAPALILSVAKTSSVVEVTASRQEIATEQVELAEKQRILGVIPNFYVVYDRNPVPLSPRQKFSLAWKTSYDQVSFLSAGFFAGIQQAQNTFVGYGQGAQGYAKRYGADYADGFTGNMLGGALFPSLFRQDPRYYYNGKGTIASRALYAVAMSFVCKGDNGHWQLDYSALAGNVAAGEISNLYYPATDRNNFGVVVDTTVIGMGESAIGNLFQEFFSRKLTPSARKRPTQ